MKAEKEKKGFRTFRIIRNVILAIIIAALTAVIVLTMITRLTGGTPSVLGYSLFRVSSGSMQPQLEVGDVIVIKSCDGMDVEKGEIITYESKSGEMAGKLVTHRVVKAPYKDNKDYYVVTKGDANFVEDDPINVNQVQGTFVTKISVLTFLYNIFVTPLGLLLIIALIIFAFFNEIVIFVKAILGIGYEDEPKESVQDIIERYQKENSENEKLPEQKESSADEE
ncbi:MAG: signal peptidase I [Ruminococcus sp.]|nr:signal peptidase I [Ruminococcus sp.]